MATLKSGTTGNFTSSATWEIVDSTSFLDSVVSTSTVGTTAANSSSFTPGAIVVNEIGVQIGTRVISPTGTFTISLWNVTAGTLVAGTSVTINVSDLPQHYNVIGPRGLGWAFFALPSSVTLSAATAYAVRLSTSNSSQVSVYTSGVANNWSRALVTTTNAAPASGDILIVAGSYLSAASYTSYTVTMDNTGVTAFGNTYVSTNGTLAYSTTPSSAFNLRLTGNMFVTSGGTLTMGTSLVAIPSSSTAKLEFNVSSSGQYGLLVSGTFISNGSRKTTYLRLAADASATATSITLSAIPSAWVSGDLLAITSTTTSAAAAEVKALSANVTTTTASIAALTNAHGGNSTTLVRAHVANLTRNVIIGSVSGSFTSYCSIYGGGPNFTAAYTQFLMMGATTTLTAAIGTANTGNSYDVTISLSACVLYQSTTLASSIGFYQGVTGLSTTYPLEYFVDQCVFYGYGSSPFTNSTNSLAAAPSITQNVVTNNLFIRCGSVVISDFSSTGTGNAVSSSTSNGINFTIGSSLTLTWPDSTSVLTNSWDDLESYSNATYGVQIINSGQVPSVSSTMAEWGGANWLVWRNGGAVGIFINIETPITYEIGKQPLTFIFSNAKLFGNGTYALWFSYIQGCTVRFENSYFWSGTTTNTQYAIAGNPTTNLSPYIESIQFDGCTFGRDHLGNTSNFTVAVMRLETLRAAGSIGLYSSVVSGTIAARLSTLKAQGYGQGVLVQNLNSDGKAYLYSNFGTVSEDTTIYKTSSPSARLTPVFAASVLASSPVRIPVRAGDDPTVSVWVRKSTIADGGAYNGNEPALYIKGNGAYITSTTLQDTMTASSGTWEQLTATLPTVTYSTVLELFVVCNGTSGWINVDEWSTSISNDTRGDYIVGQLIGQYIEPDYNTGGGGSFANAYIN
jgi:hypothetical protein